MRMSLARLLCIAAFIAAAEGCSRRSTAVAGQTSAAAHEEVSVERTINLTDAAVAALVEFLGPDPVRREDYPLRVAVEGDAASGYSYYFGFADDPNEPQYRVDSQRDVIQIVKGFPVAVRREHVPYLTGTTIDYVTLPGEGAGFKFDNPRGTLESQMRRAAAP